MKPGISYHSRAYFTGVTVSWGSRSTCICSMSRQKDALSSYGRTSSDIHLVIVREQFIKVFDIWMFMDEFDVLYKKSGKQRIRVVPWGYHFQNFELFERTSTGISWYWCHYKQFYGLQLLSWMNNGISSDWIGHIIIIIIVPFSTGVSRNVA